MLLPADRTLVERDPSLPGLALALDAEHLAARVADELPRVSGARIGYVRYKPGTSCVASGTLSTDSGDVLMHVKAVTPLDVDRTDRLVRQAAVPVLAGCGAVLLRDFAAAVVLLPNDAALPGIAALHDRGRRRRRLRSAVEAWQQLWPLPVVTLRHKPARRWVGRLGRSAVAKVYAEGEFETALRAARALSASVETAPLLGVHDADRIIIWRWTEGVTIDHVLASGVADDVAQGAGHALSHFHRHPTHGLPTFDAGGHVRAAVDAVSALLPDQAAEAASIGRALTEAVAGLAPRMATLHGDCTADQFVSGTHVKLLDVDNAAVGDPAVDLASFTADLAEKDAAVFLGGYAEAGGHVDERAVAVHASAWQLRRVIEGFRLREPDWEATAHSRLRAARGLLQPT